MRRRLVFLIRDLGFGGAQRQLATLVRALAADKAFEPHVVAFYDGALREDLEKAGVTVHCIEKLHRWDLLGFAFRLVATLRRIRPELVHGYLAEANLMSTLARPFCRNPVIVWGIRDSQSDADQWGILGKLSFRLNAILSSTPRGIIANSNAGRQWYRQRGYPMDDEDFRVIANGIDTSRFRPRADSAILRRNLGLPSEAPVVGIIGRLNPIKDHTTFLEAAARISVDMPQTRFLVMGSGPDDYTHALRECAKRVGIEDQVDWSAARQDLENVYPALDVLVSSSSFGEGFSNVIAEAMSCAVPCVTTNVGDSAALTAGTGWTCEPGDSNGLAAGILQILRMAPAERAELGQTARNRIESEFTIDRLAAQTTDALLAWLPPQ